MWSIISFSGEVECSASPAYDVPHNGTEKAGKNDSFRFILSLTTARDAIGIMDRSVRVSVGIEDSAVSVDDAMPPVVMY